MKKVFDKQLLGIEDIEIGIGKVKQTRNGEEVELDKVNSLYDAGLLKDLDRDAIPEGVEYLWFKGYYEEGDRGQGIYALVPEDAYYFSEREDDTGLYIKANGRLYEREGSWNKFPETSSVQLRGEKRHFIMSEWYGARPNDSSYNNFWILEHAYKTIYIKTIELCANQHYYFKQYTDITISRQSSIEIRGNNAYMHFDIFAGKFDWVIPTVLDYIIFRDINYASIVPVFAFDANKCKYFNIYHNSNIHQPSGKGFLYKKDDCEVVGSINLTSLPGISKINYDDNAIVTKEYVDSMYKVPDNAVLFDKDTRQNITGFKQTSITLERETPLADLSDDDIITKDEFIQWVKDNIDALLPEKKFKLVNPPTSFEYLQFKVKYKKFTKPKEEPYFVYQNSMYVDKEVVVGEDEDGMPIVEMQRVLEDYDYILDSDGYKHTIRLTEVPNKSWKCEYDMIDGDTGNQVTKVYFENATYEGIEESFLDNESPEYMYANAIWRVNKETDNIRYWEKL